MVDRERRDRLTLELIAFFRGQISNFEFEDRIDRIRVSRKMPGFPYRDRAIEAIANMAWFLYDDLHEHCLEGRYAPAGDTVKELERWLTFLRSNYEYTWPYTEFTVFPGHWLILLLTFGVWARWAGRKRRLAMESAGNMKVWPFVSADDYNTAESCFGKASW